MASSENQVIHSFSSPLHCFIRCLLQSPFTFIILKKVARIFPQKKESIWVLFQNFGSNEFSCVWTSPLTRSFNTHPRVNALIFPWRYHRFSLSLFLPSCLSTLRHVQAPPIGSFIHAEPCLSFTFSYSCVFTKWSEHTLCFFRLKFTHP